MAHCRQELPRMGPIQMGKPVTFSPPTKCLSVAMTTTQSCIVLSLDPETELMSGPLQVRLSVWHVSSSIYTIQQCFSACLSVYQSYMYHAEVLHVMLRWFIDIDFLKIHIIHIFKLCIMFFFFHHCKYNYAIYNNVIGFWENSANMRRHHFTQAKDSILTHICVRFTCIRLKFCM